MACRTGLRWRLSVFLALLALVGMTLPAAAAPAAPVTAAASSGQIADLVDAIRPAVVGILSLPTLADPDEPMDWGSGSGFVLSSDGFILTNAHVVAGSRRVYAVLHDGRVLDVERKNVWYDPTTDVALLKVDATDLHPAPLGNSDRVRIGELAVAVGYPVTLSFELSATAGIVSGMRHQTGTGFTWIQTDAPINPGNSGGPLVNSRGEVVGMNTGKIVGFGIDGVGFALPMNLVHTVVQELKQAGHVARPWLGAAIEDNFSAMRLLPGAPKGLAVQRVFPLGAAAAAGLKNGDRILSVNGNAVNTREQLTRLLMGMKPGDRITVKVDRDGGKDLAWSMDDQYWRLPTNPGVKGAGMWQNLSAPQVRSAAAHAFQVAALADALGGPDEGLEALFTPWISASGPDAAVFLSEYLQVSLGSLEMLDEGKEFNSSTAQALAEKVRGRGFFLVQMTGKDANVALGAVSWLEQGGKKIQAVQTSAWPGKKLPIGQGKFAAAVQVNVDLSKVDPKADTTLVVKTPNGQERRFDFSLWALR